MFHSPKLNLCGYEDADKWEYRFIKFIKVRRSLMMTYNVNKRFNGLVSMPYSIPILNQLVYLQYSQYRQKSELSHPLGLFFHVLL